VRPSLQIRHHLRGRPRECLDAEAARRQHVEIAVAEQIARGTKPAKVDKPVREAAEGFCARPGMRDWLALEPALAGIALNDPPPAVHAALAEAGRPDPDGREAGVSRLTRNMSG